MDLSNSPMELNAAIMSLFDNKGQFIRQWHYLQPKTTIDVADLPKGLYLLLYKMANTNTHTKYYCTIIYTNIPVGGCNH